MRYYAARAAEYERIYALPAWQRDLGALRALVASTFRDRRVLEIACGTGYWTAEVARVARSVHAEDVNAEPLALARARALGPATVTFARADAYRMPREPAGFDGGLAALWLSHVDRARMEAFLRAFHARLLPDAVVVMFDERPYATRPAPTARVDAAGNRYEPRRLASGARYEIVKNWYAAAELEALLAPWGRDVAHRELDCFWTLTYRVR